MSHAARIRPLALAAALLLALPAGASGATGGAAAPAADGAPGDSSGGAAPGAAAPRAAHPSPRVKSAGGASPHRRPRRRARRHRSAPLARTVAPAGSAVPAPTAPATLRDDGTASPPAGAPAVVMAVIAAGNRIASLPYRWGGGHASWDDVGYDCSGSVGYALHGGGLLDASETSGELASYGDPGPGTWITIYANADHVYMVVAGLRFDTSGANPSRWQTAPRSGAGFAVRHPAGL